jgi:hypothetical protein
MRFSTEIGFIRLREVCRKSHDLDAICRQPMGDGAAVEPARSGESDGLAFKIVDVHVIS